MRAANAAGEEEVRKEIMKRLGTTSSAASTMSTPKMYPVSLRGTSSDGPPSLYLNYKHETLPPFTYIN
jgi:hypothetical protein